MPPKKQIKVYLKQCHLQVLSDSKIVACLKMDQEASEMTSEKTAVNGIINFNEMLKIDIESNLINQACKFNIFIYSKKGRQPNLQMIGKATLRYLDAQQPQAPLQYQKLKIQRLNDHNAFIQACLVIDNFGDQLKKDLKLRVGTQSSSPLKRTLNSSRQQGLRSPVTTCYKCTQKDRQIEILRTDLLAAEGNNGKLIASLKQDNNVLKQILKIEQKKNNTSSKFVAEVMKILGMPMASQGINGLASIDIISQLQHRQQLNENIKKTSVIDEKQFQRMKIEKDELYQLTEDLQNDIRALKEQHSRQKRQYEAKIQQLSRQFQKNQSYSEKTKYSNQISSSKKNWSTLQPNKQTIKPITGSADFKKISNALELSLSERKLSINKLQNCQKQKIQPKIYKDMLGKLNEELQKSYAQVLKKRLTKEIILSHKQEVRKLLQTHIF